MHITNNDSHHELARLFTTMEAKAVGGRMQRLLVAQLGGFSRRICGRLNLCNFAKDVFSRYPSVKSAVIVANERKL